MLKKFKQAALQSLKTSGVSTLVHNSRWRRQRLLILAYHGISLDDEHLWNGSLFISAGTFRSRLQQLKESKCTVLPLDQAIERLYAGDLPDRAVALTFDDGTSDFSRKAFPLLKEFDLPATLYLTTFYSEYQQPVFDPMCSYLLWKGRQATLDLKRLTGQASKVELSDNDSREAALSQIHSFSREQKLTAHEKTEFAASLAAQLGVDYETLRKQRIMHNLTAEEVRQLARDGVDIQLHTHRHRTPKDRKLFLREIADNRASIKEMTGGPASHFCYPSGVYDPMFLPWLREAGVVSATTCELGFASRSSNRLLLPRFLDNESLSDIEFESWLTGVSLALPRRRIGLGQQVGGAA
ncbi:MAG TPA: polysaccharide deacetylase family protein [Pyrinomonadaceae bacterium]|nr:polysaccharide deacetylase family protein [Pyrinomonadaceae bacterium]